MSTLPPADPLDPVNNPRHPFGLPLGTVRGFLSLLIGGFFWFVLLTPNKVVEPLLAHYFMLFLVLLVFSPYSKGDVAGAESRFLPRLLRFLFLAGSVATIAAVATQFPERFGTRLQPNPDEFRDWGGVYLAVTFAAFLGGQFVRFVLGRDTPAFQILRAWLSLLGTLLLAGELIFWAMAAGAENRPDIHAFQAVSLGLVAAYFGTRA